ncbi:hypothetical protein MtrunA17_Chr8g0350251 [Medicago truncatula]|uniref:Uncharacterized protein n=1 Tax=Medicago truncatula TaxID=3880 RepID=A0A396GMX2_MEDTR|nr:hypothetical protein MtrunA17_Chr8g0350251 [Medicago truncatula]
MDPEHTSEVATHGKHCANSKDAAVNPLCKPPFQLFPISDMVQ